MHERGQCCFNNVREICVQNTNSKKRNWNWQISFQNILLVPHDWTKACVTSFSKRGIKVIPLTTAQYHWHTRVVQKNTSTRSLPARILVESPQIIHHLKLLPFRNWTELILDKLINPMNGTWRSNNHSNVNAGQMSFCWIPKRYYTIIRVLFTVASKDRLFH